MIDLHNMECEACRKDAPAVTREELQSFKPRIPDWEIVEKNGVPRLKRVFPFSNFAEALAFTLQVGELAEKENHHPKMITEWGKVTVFWWTHKIRNLHRNDFILAAKTDTLVDNNGTDSP